MSPPRMPAALVFTWSPAAIPMLVASAAIFALGIFVIGRERGGVVSLSFLSLTITVSIWLTATAAAAASSDATIAFFFARVAYVGIPFIPSAVLQFTLALLGQAGSRKRWLAASWACSGVFAVLFTTTRLLLSGTWSYSWGFYPRLTSWSAAFLTFFAAALSAALLLLARAKPQSAQERRRDAAFFTALSIGYLGSLDYLPAFGIPLFPLGCAAIAGFIILACRSVVRFRLADLSPSFVADNLLRTMHGGVIVVDTRGRVQILNDVAARLLGWSVADVRHADLKSLLGVGALPMTGSDSFSRRNESRDRVMRWKRADGTDAELLVSATRLRNEEGDVVGVLYALADLTDRRRAEEAEFGAAHDLLTGLPNRSRFFEAFDENRARILEAGRVPAVLFLDLDGFKAVNDEHGHQVGDALLRLVAARIRNAIRGTDEIARYGGDEFVLLLDLARSEDARLVGAKLVRVVSEAYQIDDRRVSVGASIGAAFYPTDGANCEELVRVADGAMYAAKRAGKGRLQIRTDVAAAPVFNIDARA